MSQLVSAPDGPVKKVPGIGQLVATFSADPGGKTPALNYHVPLECRGPFRPKDLANYDPKIKYRTDEYGYVLCYSRTARQSKCNRRAVNRANKCDVHGGRLHPLDKVKKREAYEDSSIESLDRYQQFIAGQISAEDLDDEELATASFRGPNGKLYRPRNLPRSVVEEFHKAIYSRAEDGLRAGVVIGANTIVEIASNRAVEPADRIKASQILLDRGLGKAPDRVQIGLEPKGFEQILDKIANVTRDESRERRGIIDAEVVEDSAESPRLELEPGIEKTNGGIERAFSRHEAVMAQELKPIKPFEYDLSDQTNAINRARNKRYAANKLGVAVEDLGKQRFQFVFLPVGDGTARVKIIDPEEDIKAPQSVLKKEKQKRKFDNSPFGNS